MPNLHIDTTETTPVIRRRLARVLAVGAVAAGAAVGFAVPAHAASIKTYHVSGTTGAGSRAVVNPSSSTATTIATLTEGTTLTIDCGVRARSIKGNTVWHHITSPVTGYVADYYTDTPGFNRFITGEPTCAATTAPTKPTTAPTKPTTTPTTTTPTTPTSTPTTPVTTPTTPATTKPATTPTPTTPATTPTTPADKTPAAVRGATVNYNEGVGGSCVYYALDRFHTLTGVYPKAFGDAKYLASGAAASGWTVTTTPRVDSMVVFQPGQNGAAAPTGHTAWVEQVSGDRIYIAEMNAPSAYVITYRWLTPAAGVQYIYAV